MVLEHFLTNEALKKQKNQADRNENSGVGPD